MFEDKIKVVGNQIFDCVDSYRSLLNLICSGDFGDCDECPFYRICSLEHPFEALSNVILSEFDICS